MNCKRLFHLVMVVALFGCEAVISAEVRSNSGSDTSKSDTSKWSSFRGPSGMGNAESDSLSLRWDDDSNIKWKTALPGAGASSPVVFGDRIYVTAYSGYFVPGEDDGNVEDLKRHLIALDRETGRAIWDKVIPAKLPEEDRIRDHGFAANTPSVDDDHVYVFFGKSGVFAFDHDGNVKWQKDVGSKTHGWGTAASVLLFEDMVIINASVESQTLYALDRQTGKERWQATGIKQSWNTPVIVTANSGRKELVVARFGDVLAFDPTTGKPLWSCKTDIKWYMVPTAVSADGVVYYLGGRSGTAALAVRAGGTGDVTDTHRLWTSPTGSNVTSPILKDGLLYWASESKGRVFCAEAKTGKILYDEKISRFGQVYACPILAGDRIYYFTRNGKTFVVKAAPEFELLSTNTLGDRSRFDASPAVDGDRLLLRSEKFLYCIED